MGLAPSGNGENPGKSAVAKVPVPIFSQPRSVPTTLELNNLFLRGRLGIGWRQSVGAEGGGLGIAGPEEVLRGIF
jgi:hypothetical protein